MKGGNLGEVLAPMLREVNTLSNHKTTAAIMAPAVATAVVENFNSTRKQSIKVK